MKELGAVLISIVLFAAVFGIFFLWISSRHKERMALIEKGASAEKIFGDPPQRAKKWILNLGILACGIALGVLVGYGLEHLGMADDQAYPASIFLFGGAALVAAYFISRKVNGKS